MFGQGVFTVVALFAVLMSTEGIVYFLYNIPYFIIYIAVLILPDLRLLWCYVISRYEHFLGFLTQTACFQVSPNVNDGNTVITDVVGWRVSLISSM